MVVAEQAGLRLIRSQASKAVFFVTGLLYNYYSLLSFFNFYGCVSLSHRLIYTENRKQKMLCFAFGPVNLHFSTQELKTSPLLLLFNSINGCLLNVKKVRVLKICCRRQNWVFQVTYNCSLIYFKESHFFFIRRLGPSIYRSPPKISGISSTQKNI